MTGKHTPYVGSGAIDRVGRWLDAYAARERNLGPRTAAEPRGVVGVPADDGYYYELFPDDIQELVELARRAG